MTWYYALLLKLAERLARYAARKQYEISKKKVDDARRGDSDSDVPVGV